jgi:hypothetical protein
MRFTSAVLATLSVFAAQCSAYISGMEQAASLKGAFTPDATTSTFPVKIVTGSTKVGL